MAKRRIMVYFRLNLFVLLLVARPKRLSKFFRFDIIWFFIFPFFHSSPLDFLFLFFLPLVVSLTFFWNFFFFFFFPFGKSENFRFFPISPFMPRFTFWLFRCVFLFKLHQIWFIIELSWINHKKFVKNWKFFAFFFFFSLLAESWQHWALIITLISWCISGPTKWNNKKKI